MNTWYKVADWVKADSFTRVADGLEAVHDSEMPEDVRVEAAILLQELFDLQRKLNNHSKNVLSKMDGVMWPDV